jgi:hypothetical protein
MKGISTIIASIIMVVITIGLISVAYLYMSGLIGGTTAQNIALLDAYCDSNSKIVYTLIKNDGTANIPYNRITFYIDGASKDPNLECKGSWILTAGNATNCNITATASMHQLRIVGPSNSVGGSVDCK